MSTAEQAKYATKKLALQENKLVTRPIARLDSSITKGKGGRKKKYTPTTIRNAINKYFAFCETQDEMPSIKGLMIHLKMYKDQFYQYLQYPEFTDIMEHTRLIIAHWAENDVYTTKGLAAGKVAYMKNVHGWSDKLETSNTSTTTVISVDQAKAKIEMLAPQLLEILKSAATVNQLASRPQVVDVSPAEPLPSKALEVNPNRRV